MSFKNFKRLFFIFMIIIALSLTTDVLAQEYPPGFDFRIEWDHFAEQSKERREINVTDIGARVGYNFPRTLDLYIALSYQDMDCKLSVDGTDTEKLDLESALAFKVGTKVYVLKRIPIGIPADLTLSFAYSTARHKEDVSGYKFKHNRILGYSGLEWRYQSASPFLNLGVLNSSLKGPEGKKYDQNSLYFSAGSFFRLVEDMYFKIEMNWCQEVGYAVGVQYRF